MNFEIHEPELERMVQEEILSGQFRNVDDLLLKARYALREQNAAITGVTPARCNLADFLLESPFAGSDLQLDRHQDYGRPVDL